MIQEITAYIILAIAFGIGFYKIFHFFDVFRKPKSSSACHSCATGSCAACSFNTAGRI